MQFLSNHLCGFLTQKGQLLVMYFSIIFFVQEILKLMYSLSGCLIIEDMKCLSSNGFLVMSSLLLTSFLSTLVIPTKLPMEQNSST